MLWTTTAILSCLTLVALGVRDVVGRRPASAEIFAGMWTGWGVNAIAGASVFLTVPYHDFWVWKPLLAASSLVFVGLLGSALYVQRRVVQRADAEPAAPAEASPPSALAIGLGVAGVFAGMVAVAAVWLLAF